MRKGFDLFLQVWRLLRTVRKPIHFVWLGGIDPGLREWLGAEIEEAEATGTFQLAGFRSDVGAFYEIADLFLYASEHEGFCVPLVEAFVEEVQRGLAISVYPDSLNGSCAARPWVGRTITALERCGVVAWPRRCFPSWPR